MVRHPVPTDALSSQPLDLTDMDYSNALWIAVQDTDERNAALALRIWDDNGLDVKEDILPQILGSLGKYFVAIAHLPRSESPLFRAQIRIRTSLSGCSGCGSCSTDA